MTADDIKRRVSMADLFRRLGSSPDLRGRWQCLLPDRHNHGDAHHSVGHKQETATCFSQGCFTGDDIFGVIGKVEQLPSFPEQRTQIGALFGLDLPLTATPERETQMVAEYDYHTEDGTFLFQVVRYHPKTFKQRRRDAHGQWVWNLHGVTPCLYRLPEVSHAEQVLLVEGEKDVETAYAVGLPDGWAATCNPMGAGKWRPAYSESLRNKRVVILPDQDEVGRRHGETIATFLHGIAAEIRWLSLPHGKDITEWVETQNATSADLLTLLHAASPYIPRPTLPRKEGLTILSMAELLNEPDEPIAWLVDTLLPMGGLSVIGGKPKTGKSTTVRNLCLAVARGEPFLGFPTAQGTVLYCAFEEKREEVKRHFHQLGATDEDQIMCVIGKAPHDFLKKIATHLDALKPALIILDTLVKVTHIRDMNDYSQVMQALDPFLHLARDSHAHLMLVHHAGKSDRQGGDNLLGSTAIFGTVDTCLIQKRAEHYRTLQSENRYGQDLDETVLEWDEECRAITLGSSKQDTDVERLVQDIRAFLDTQEMPVSRAVIEKTLKGGTGPLRKALKKLVETGQVERSGRGRKSNPFLFSCLVVPPTGREHANKQPKNREIPDEHRADACSHNRTPELAHEPVPEHETEDPGQSEELPFEEIML